MHDGQQPKIYLANSKTKHFPDTLDSQLESNSPEEEHIQQTQHQQLQQHQQQAPLPHIEEEEETPQTSPEDEVTKKK